MTNDEFQVTKEIRMTKLDRRADVRFGHSGFALLSSFIIRHSSLSNHV